MNLNISAEIFRAYDIRGVVGSDLFPAVALRIGESVGTYIRGKGGSRVAVGMDNRLTSATLKHYFTHGLLSSGCDVIDIGLSTSPLLYKVVTDNEYDAGINVTASHNPKEYNGFKIVGPQAYPIAGDEIAAIRDIAISGASIMGQGTVSILDPRGPYIDRILSTVELKRRLRVVLDTGNGVAGKFAPELLTRLGCEVIELHCDLDGRFPHHLPNPEHEENVVDVEQKVIEVAADIGIAIDGDGDRVGIVDENGRYRESDYAIILLARDYLSRHPGATVLVDVKSSMNVIDEIKRMGGIPLLYKTGHSFIKQKMRAEGIMLGGELSGHLYVFEKYYPFDDALYAAAKILSIVSQYDTSFSKHFADLPKLYATPIIEIPCSDQSKFVVVSKVAQLFAGQYDVNTIDGARVDFLDGWAIVRASNTTPVLTFRAEAKSTEALKVIIEQVFGALRSFPEVSLPAINPNQFTK